MSEEPETLCDVCGCERPVSETATCECGMEVCDGCRPGHECETPIERQGP